MATVPELSAGKVYIGPEPRQDRSIKSIESGGKQFDGTLAVTGTTCRRTQCNCLCFP